MIFRQALLSDIPQIMMVRMRVKENVLSNPKLVTDKDCAEYMTVRGRGWVCETENRIAGFAIADRKEQNIWALFIDPDFEKKGIGKKLQELMLDWYFTEQNFVWLSTAQYSRAETFYTMTGWTRKEILRSGEIKFEMHREDWIRLRNG